ncbi:uncharacterized protein LOC131891201 [Tigriopus californicus]|uniref:uncharacterized protein LOC131891201 n=1 Tax=Tigriopus californicus TaxID=6832 RepID=UPI0027D9D032|nr:uncharacterized protein LOC131891201 [Tigriopus californicus]
MSTPCGQLQMRGGHLNQVRVECFKKDPSFVSYGLCQSSQCFTTSGMVCAFPFRFKGRMYDQCITLGSKNGRPWCSTKTDRDHNHIDGMEADCNADCSVNNCPIGYQRLYGTQTCYKLSPSHPAKMASSFERAQDSCSLDGGRLLQPRSKSALQTMKNVEQFTVFQSTIISHVALGLMVHFESGLVKLYYSDGTMVPFKVQESMMEWDDSFPEEDATKACVAIMTVTGKLRNVPCQGYFNGTNEGHGKLGYICEARPIETLEADPIQVCHLPFIYNSTRHVGCAQSVHASTEMDTQGFPWCATEVNDRGEMVPGKWGKCRDERTIAYDNAVGHYCSVPFLMNKRYYDSCTRHATTPSALNRYYWCPIPSEASLNVSYSNVGIKGSCTDFLIPEENGCGDHYDDVGDMCMRVSTFPVNFDEAVEACNQDGADLIAIVDDVIRDAAIKLIEKKRLQFEHFRNMNYFWIAGRFSNQSQWHWTTHFQPFNKYTQWQANTPNYACKSTGCTHLNALLMQRDEDYSWRAADLGEQFGYVCLSKCSKGYTWYSKVQKCLKVVSYGAQNEKKRNLPQSLVQCGKDQGSLVALRSCQEMEMLNQQLADFFYPVDQVFQIGVFGFLKDPQANRHAPTDQLTDSRGYSMGLSTTFEKSRGLCDAKDSLLTDTLEESKTYGFGLKRAKGGLVTFHQEIVAQASQMSSYGYICHQEPIFGCPEGYAIFQDKCIKVFHQEQTKIDAEMTCRKDGAHLAKPSTHLEIQFIDELIRESEREMGITDLRDYWLGYNRQLDGDLDPLGLWNTTKHRCNCLGLPANNISGLFEDGDKCLLKSWSKLNVTKASNTCQSFNGILATAATEDEYERMIFYLESQNGLPMAVGLENPSGMSCTTPSSCGFLWMDENNTPANFSTFSESKIPDLKGDVESRCVGITDSGNFETVLCSSEMTSLCQFQCPSGVDTQFTDCMTLEHFGPGHILLQSKCTEQAGFVCSKDQTVKPTLVEDAAEPVVLAPLNKALGSKDISKQGIVLEDHFVGYASFGQKSRLIGYPMLGGQSMSGLSYIEIKSGPEKFVFGTGLTVMFWLKIDQSPMDNFPLLHAHFNGNGSLKVGDALKLPGLIGKDQFNDSRTFHGSLSCLQIFNKGMLPSYVRFHKHCQNASSQVTDPCPEGFDFFDGMCYKIAISLASFIEAEIACSSNRDETGRYRSQLMWTRKLGESEFWVGLDDLAGLGEFETSTGGEFVNRSDPIWAILNAGQGDCAKIPGPNGGFLTTDVCSKPLAYVCQQRPLYESPDNHCPDGFFSYKSSCLLPVREEMEFNQAQIHCGLHGSSLYASKSLADFQFIKQYARNHIRIDIWMGVERKSVIQSFDASEDNALEALETNDKSYADGAEFFDSTSFGFEFTSNGGIWQGPCPNPEHRFNTQLETRNAPRSTPSFANGNSRIF